MTVAHSRLIQRNCSNSESTRGGDLLCCCFAGLACAVGLPWQEVKFDRKEIERVTQKRRKQVILPLNVELLFVLEAEHERNSANGSERF